MAGKIKKLLENELVGGTQSSDVYPVTSIKAVYDEDNERLDNIINRRGVVNISTNYNSDHIAEVLTLSQAIAKIPSKDRVLGFQGKFLTSEGWKSYMFTGDSLSNWTDATKWIEQITSAVLAQELGNSSTKAISQEAVTKEINNLNSNTGVSEYEEFSEEKSYIIGDIVIKDGHLKEFTTDHPIGAWIGTDTKNVSLKKINDTKFSELNIRAIISEIYAPNINWSEVGFIQFNLLYETGGKFYNAIYLKGKQGEQVSTIIDISYDTIDEAKSFFETGIKEVNGNYLNISKAPSSEITIAVYDYYNISDIKLSPSIMAYLLKVDLTNDPIFNQYVKELYAPNVSISDINSITLNVAKYIGGKYYNSLYLRKTDSTVVIFDENFDSLEEAQASFWGIKGNIEKGFVLLQNGFNQSTQLDFVVKFSHELLIEYCPSIRQYLNEGISDDFRFNLYVKELYSPNVALSDINSITLNVAKYIGGRFYNSLYLRKSDSTVVIFDENFGTREEAQASFVGIKGGANGFVLLQNAYNISTQLNYVVKFRHELNNIDYCPSINLYINLAKNPLNAKTVIWEGDSIMADNEYNSTGWRTRIENSHAMKGTNYSKGGSTFTANLEDLDIKYNISLRIDTEIENNPNIDYFILDGGTNDADRIGRIVDYKEGSDNKIVERIDRTLFPEKFGTWNDVDFSGNYNKDTFCGAVEYVFYKLLSSYKNVRFGFIIAPKMGLTNSLAYFNRLEYFKEITLICKKWGIPYIDLWNTTKMNPNIPIQFNSALDKSGNVEAGSLYLDGQHPSPAGYDYTAPIVAEWMKHL